MVRKWLVSSLLLVGITCFSRLTRAQDHPVATVAGRAISAAELEERVGDRLLRLKTEEYTIRLAILNEQIDQMLLEREAGNRGISVADLTAAEVRDRIAPVSEPEARAVMETSRTLAGLPKEQALRVTMEEIRLRRTATRRAEFLASLRKIYPTEVNLEAARLKQPVPGGQANGSTDAPVSLTVFSDFQCPYCSTLDGSLRRIAREYSPVVRIVAKQFPLPAHPQASQAAEAALCAAQQARYWEMHEALFSNQGMIAQQQFSELARRSGVDVAGFEDCLASHKALPELHRDIADARALGIASTPTIFINGLMIIGAKPYDSLKDLIGSELGRAKQASAAAANRSAPLRR